MTNFLRKRYRDIIRVYQYDRYVLARVACLGQDLFNSKYDANSGNKTMINMQKVRVDMFKHYMNSCNRPNSSLVEPFMLRQDIFPLVVQQEQFEWFKAKKTSNLILMDSFSELTDQKFVHIKEGWGFCCNYTDIDHSAAFKSNFECLGLINIDDLGSVYDEFFGFINKYFHKKEIVFVHFPTVLDIRNKFNERGKCILEILLYLEKKYKNIRNLYIEDTQVFPYPGDDFPYHFDKNTQSAFLEKWVV